MIWLAASLQAHTYCNTSRQALSERPLQANWAGNRPVAAAPGGGSTRWRQHPVAAAPGGGSTRWRQHPVAAAPGGGSTRWRQHPVAAAPGGGSAFGPAGCPLPWQVFNRKPCPHLTEAAVNMDLVDRPNFHVMPPRGWLNDPNGLVFYKGRYHVFYQNVEEGCEWNWGLVWGHAVSEDLVTWRHLLPALCPTPGSADADGCWSGCCATGPDGLPVLLYTGVRLRSNPDCGPLPPPDCDLGLNWIETQLAAVPVDPDDDLLVHWQKATEPILPLPPPGLGLTGWRDPFVLGPGTTPGEGYTMLLGSGFKGKGGALLVYQSPHLLHGWEYAGPLCSGEGAGTPGGAVWECPFLLPLPAATDGSEKEGQQWLLTASPYPAVPPHAPSNPVLYWTGALAAAGAHPGLQFDIRDAQGPFRLDLGDLMYAPTVCRDAKGRWILWGWVQERRRAGSYSYAGCLTLPRHITPGKGGHIRQAPVPEVELLRQGAGWHAPSLLVHTGTPLPLGGHPSLALDVQLTLQRGSASAAGLVLECYGAEGDGDVMLMYNWATNRLELIFAATTDGLEDVGSVLAELALPSPLPDTQHTQHAEQPPKAAQRPAVGGELVPAPGSLLRLRLLLDHSCLEVFTGEGQVLTTRVYRGALPPHPTDSGVSLAALGGSTTVLDVSVWPMGSCWRKDSMAQG